MTAKDTLRCNKTAMLAILSTGHSDYKFILNKVHEGHLINQREYNNLKSIVKEDVEGHVTELLDKLMNKGEGTCRDFLLLLQMDEDIKATYPQLKDIQWGGPASLLSTPIQSCTDAALCGPSTAACVASDVLPPESKRQKKLRTSSVLVGQGTMDLLILSRIDEELESSEVAVLCFLCRDVINRKCLETVQNGKELFLRLEEKGLLKNNFFLSQLLSTIRRADLLNLLETNSRRPEESSGPQADAAPVLSDYRVMLYRIYEDMTQMNVDQMKFLLSGDLRRRQIENCKTALDVFAEMEKTSLLSNTSLDKLHTILKACDRQLALEVQSYRDGTSSLRNPPGSATHLTLDDQRIINFRPSLQPSLSVTGTQPNLAERRGLCTGAEQTSESPPPQDAADYYSLTHNPRGVCMIISNENFSGSVLKNRPGTEEDEKALREVFSRLGFEVELRQNLTAEAMREELVELGRRDFLQHDALVVCVLSHGAVGCVFGNDGKEVLLRELTQPFATGKAQTLAGKPKLFFVQACQGQDTQRGAFSCPPKPTQRKRKRQSSLDEDAGPIQGETVPFDADLLMGMATVQDCRSFRHISTGSIYIQELCRQLQRSAESRAQDDILTVLTRVNREVSRGVYLNSKQMPEPKYTLTKTLVLKYV